MKLTAIIFITILAVMIFYTWLQGTETFSLAWKNSGKQLLSFVPIMVMAVIMAAFAETLMPKGFVDKWLSEEAGFKGILLAWGAGILTPGAGIVGMPLVAGLYKAGAGLPVIMTYLTSIATLSFVKMPIEAGFYGWKITFIRVGVSLILPLIAGGLTQVFISINQMR
ncbi:MAG: permease [Rhizobiales bacterium]|nr:permease [Hyphomicrobiales bacterium]NRB13619.1 permease [Hyphomicrobiales bacterium]